MLPFQAMKHPFLTAALSAAATLALATTAYACSCIRSTPAENYTRADVVFSGVVQMVALPRSSDGNGTTVYSVAVNRVWKGAVPASVSVTSAESSATCGIGLQKNGEYVIFGYKNADGTFSTNLCSGTALVSDAQETLTYLNNRGSNGADCRPIVCSDGRRFDSCDANGEPLMWTGGTPCFDEANPQDSCQLGICPDGYRYPTCSEDGHPINYFADPCMNHQTTSFRDVTSEDPDYEAIVYVKEQGIVQGYPDGTFRPDANITRAEFVKMLMSATTPSMAINECLATATPLPSDVPRTEWFASYVCAAKKSGVVSGYPDNTFRPGNSINLAEAAKIIVEAMGLPKTSARTGAQWWSTYLLTLDSLNGLPAGVSSADAGMLLTRGTMANILWRVQLSNGR